MKRKARVLLILFISLSMIAIPQELSWIVNHSTTNVASAIDEIEPQSPVPLEKATEEATLEVDPSSYEAQDPPAFVEKPYNADTIAEDAEAEQAYRDSVVFVENKIVFSVLDYREKGAKAKYLTAFSELCLKYNLKKVELILEVKTDKAEKKEGLTAYQVFYSATVKTDDIWAVVDEMAKEDGVMSAEPDFIWESAAVGDPEPTTEEMANEWILDNQNATEVWGSLDGLPGEDVVVAVIDTGVDYTHNDLKNNMWVNPNEVIDGVDNDGNGYIDDVHGINLIANSGDPQDDNGHGTHVAGIIGMTSGNGGGVGLAYGAKIMAIKAGQQSGSFASTDIAKAIQYATDNGADVINMSFGGVASKLVEAALEDAFSSAVLVAAAGNNYGNPALFPASLPYVVGVMASSSNNVLASFSNLKSDGLVAPGVEVYSTLPGGRYAKWSGTSMAAPVVSAAAAIIRAQNPNKQAMNSRLIMGQLLSSTESIVNGYPALNIADSLGKAPKPRLSIEDIITFDSPTISDTNNGDGIIQSGETIDLGIAVRNKWGSAKNVKVTFNEKTNDVNNPYIELIENQVSLGEIGSFSSANNGYTYNDGELIGVSNPIRLKVSDTTPNDAEIKLSISITGANGIDDKDNNTYNEEGTFIFTVENGQFLRGTISTDTTLTNDRLWIMDRAVKIDEGVTVNVEPGTKIQFYGPVDTGAYAEKHIVYLRVNGKLNCNGTEAAPIEIFPSKGHEDFGVCILSSDSTYDSYYGAINAIDLSNVDMNYTKIINPSIAAGKLNHCTLIQSTDWPLLYNENTYGGEWNNCSLTNTISELNNSEMRDFWASRGGNSAGWGLTFINNATSSLITGCGTDFRLDSSSIRNCVMMNNKRWISMSSLERSNVVLGAGSVFSNNAVLENMQETWAYYQAESGNVDGRDNFWGTTSESLIEKIIYDNLDDPTLGKIDYSSILTLDDDMSAIYPFVTEAYITDETGEIRLDNASNNQKVQMHVRFNRDMDQDTEPLVSIGGAEPYTDYAINGDWVSAREWVGDFTIAPMCSEGTQYIRVKGGAAADDTWLLAGTDAARFHFVVARNTAESLNLQGTGGSNCNNLMWIQDDYETLAGYNLYRSTSYDKDVDLSEQGFERINASIIAEDTKEYTDTNVEQGVDYYYYFTVMDTAFNESEPSNIVKCTPLDEEAPIIAHDPITEGTKGRQLSIDASLTDNVGVTSATVRYRVAGSTSWQSAEMRNVSGDLYRGTISAYETKVDLLEYYLEVSDGRNISRNGSETEPHVISMSDEIFAESIELSDQSISIAPGETRKITANTKPADTTNKNVTWSSSNESIATVDNEGNVTGVKSGSAEITATATNGVTAKCTVTVEVQTDTVVYADSINTSKGDTIDVPVMIRSNSGISSMRLKLIYPKDWLTPIAINKGDLLKNAYVAGNNSEPGTYYALFTNTKNITEDGILYTITFDVAKSAPDKGGDISFDYEPGDVSNANHEDIRINTEATHIGIKDAILGDVYEDGKINSHDMTSMQQYLTELITFTKHQRFLADMNEDEKVNMQDMVALAQKYLNPTGSSGLSGLMSIFRLGASRLEGSIGSAALGDDMTVALPVTFTASPDIAAYKFAVNYDGSLYRLESIDSAGTDNGSFMTNVEDAGAGRAVVTWYGNDNTDICTHNMSLNFIAVGDDISDKSAVTMTYEDGDICDIDGKTFEAEIASGAIYPFGEPTQEETERAEALSALTDTVTDAKSVSNADGKYTAESYQALQDAIAEAERVATNNDSTTDQLRDAKAAVEQARSGLVHAPTQEEIERAEALSALTDTITDARAVSNADGKYTAESYQALQDAIAEAERVAADNNSTAEQLRAAKTAVEQAKTGLALAPTDVTPTPVINPAYVAPELMSALIPAEIQDLPTVKISKPKAAKKAVTVKWKKVNKKNLKKIGGIEIQVATDPDFTNIIKSTTAGKKNASKKIKGLTSKQTYWVRIRAFNNAADGKHVSAWKSKKFKAK